MIVLKKKKSNFFSKTTNCECGRLLANHFSFQVKHARGICCYWLHFGTLLFMSTSEWNCPAFQTNLRMFRLSFSRFFSGKSFFFSRATDTGVLLQQTMKSHIWIMHSASPSSYKQTDLSHTIFLTAANQAGWMNCMHLACRWTSASNCRSQITFTEDEKKKRTVAQLLSELAWYIVLAPLICTCL